ncbi:hypothetical protein JD844_017383 [Phrynosoma platyrhinos]|uniref:PLA2c domain-containing protein n=1 Tax=Phrynosoma platyrhinos TaxID=52577 RepID=A0ABQ7SLR7_PHRPL|nr:hypothetical protein JD844_017383 [Phrynosoma platyrhinos]
MFGQVPVIAILGSGGGFRAMVGFSGVMKALYESGILDCATYIAGLSGSTWYAIFFKKNPFHYCGLQNIRMDATLSAMKEKVNKAQSALPLFTCLHVKPDVSELMFADWVEFTPYEIGMAKYGTFMTPDLFGSKFFMGTIVKKYKENPLHFLMGNKNCPPACLEENIRLRHLVSNDSDSDDESQGPEGTENPDAEKVHEQNSQESWVQRMFMALVGDSALFTTREGRAGKVHNFMLGLNLNTCYPLSPLAGFISQESMEEDEMDTAVADPDEFERIYEPLDVKSKKIHIVDSGLTFNLPYPLILRPQRGVDLIISFDFSARPSDSSPPFKEILLAEKWAKMNKLPFPKIDPYVFDREGLKECYVFKPKNPASDIDCPTIIHFVLANINFRNYKAPGVPRETQEEKDFADFDIFDDPDTPFSTFNFQISQIIKEAIADSIEYRRQNPSRCSVSLSSVEARRYFNKPQNNNHT